MRLSFLVLSTTRRSCLLHLIKQNCLLKTFLGTLVLMTQVCLYLFSVLELIYNYNISVTPKLVKKVVTKFDLSETSGPDDILLVVLKNCKPKLSYILAELFNISLKESCFPDCWKVSSVVTVFKYVRGEGVHQKTTACLIFFLWLVKSLKNL